MKKLKIRYKLRRIIAAGAAVMLALSAASAYAAWDGIDETASAQSTVPLLNFNSAFDIIGAGGIPDDSHVKNGNMYSIGWIDMNKTTKIVFGSVPRDWTGYERLDLWLYADGSEGNQYEVVINTDYGADNSWNYFRSDQRIDWEGWKKISLPLDKLTITRNPGWEKVTSFELRSTGWEMNPNGCVGSLYIADASITAGDGTSLSLIYTDDTVQAAKDAIGGGAAVYAGSPNVVVRDGEVKKLYSENEDVCAYQTAEKVLVPISFFKDYMGAEVEETDTSYKVKLGGKELAGKPNETGYTIGDKQNNFTEPSQILGGLIYVPLAETAKELGWFTVEDGAFAAVGPDDSIEALKRDLGVNELSEVASYLAAHISVDPNALTADDCAAVKDRWRHELVGSEADNDVGNPDIAAKIKVINDEGDAARKTMIRAEGQTELFTGITTTASSHMTSTYQRIYKMALAYGTYGTELYHNEELKNDILYALDWMYKHRYGVAEMNGTGWRSTSDFNWWDWKIGSPQYLVPTMIILEDSLTPAMIKDYLALFDKLVPVPYDTGSNALNTALYAIGSALLQNDAKKVIKIQNLVESSYLFVDNGRNPMTCQQDPSKTKGQGFYTDGSYVFHVLHPLNGTYGREQFTLIGPFLSMFAGTAFEITTPQANNVASWIYNAFDPLIYQGSFFRMVGGRYPEEVRTYGTTIVGGMLDTLDFLSPADQAKVKSIIKGRVLDDNGVNFYTSLKLMQAIRLNKLMNDESVQPRENYMGNHVYYNQDKVVHQRGDYALGVSMSSSRIFNYESINSMNMNGWYISDGMTEYRVKGNSRQAEGTYWKYIDPYRLPGTTVDTQEREAVSISNGYAYLSGKDFVGAANIDETYGTAAMWLESYHNSQSSDNVSGAAPQHNCDLTAKKSYFMFDDDVVCLGTDVNASTGAEVLTVVDNKLASKTVKHSAAAESEPYSIVGVNASDTPEEENIAEHTVDDDYETRWAAKNNATITWDLGEEKQLGFVTLAFMNGSKRTQKFTLETSTNGSQWVETFSGSSSGKTEMEESFTLNNTSGRFVRFTNLGNSDGGEWVSLSEAKVYPPNADGSIGIQAADIVGADAFYADGKQIELTADDTDLTGTTWAHFENVGGYYFPQGGNLKARYTRQTNSFMELWFSHGVDPEGGTYAYALLPNKTPDETAAYAADPDIEILSNTPELQAVRDKKAGLTGIVFWEAGSYGDITVDKPMIVMMEEADGKIKISASDPTQKLSEANITVKRAMKPISSDIMMSVTNSAAGAVIHLDLKDSQGRPMQADFEPE